MSTDDMVSREREAAPTVGGCYSPAIMHQLHSVQKSLSGLRMISAKIEGWSIDFQITIDTPRQIYAIAAFEPLMRLGFSEDLKRSLSLSSSPS